MALRTILKYPDKRLRVPGKPVASVEPALGALLDDMAETMYAAPGVGLAATQIGLALRVFVLDLQQNDEAERATGLQVFINPEILERRGEVVWEEGCLSFPGIHEDIHRDGWIRARALDRSGQPFEVEAEGLYAVAIQHEIDHLDGVLLVDRVSLLKRRFIHRKMLKWHQAAQHRESHEEPEPPGRPAL
ncbi:MAG: peptide deformylase [Deltaproteobacteria bacterium]|nr:peptide deformylase [Deltaproteobacteria bacterium]